MLDEIDNQLAELKVSPEELADIQRPFVKMSSAETFIYYFKVYSGNTLRS